MAVADDFAEEMEAALARDAEQEALADAKLAAELEGC